MDQRHIPRRTHSENVSPASVPKVTFNMDNKSVDQPGVSSPSQFLHSLLEARRAETRSSRGTSKTMGDERLAQSSPAVEAGRKGRRATDIRVQYEDDHDAAGKSGMGARAMDDHLSTLHKQNFDLKLEIFHRRQRTTALEEQLEEMEGVKATNVELQEVNDELLAELEKRDKAVEEAISMICDLEGQIESYRQATSPPRGPDPYPSSPPRMPCTPWNGDDVHGKMKRSCVASSRLIELATPHSAVATTPAYLRSERGSLQALRQLYLDGPETERVPETPRSPLESIASPRLSVLSKSSFLSVYGPMAKLDLNDPSPAPELSPSQSLGDERDEKVRDWISSRPHAEEDAASPSLRKARQAQLKPREEPRRDRERPKDSGALYSRSRRTENRSQHQDNLDVKPKKTSSDRFMDGPIFSSNYLPPTPDTLSTADLHQLSHNASAEDTASLLDGTPAPARSFSALQPSTVRSMPSRSTRSTQSARSSHESIIPDLAAEYDDIDANTDVDGSVRAVKSEVSSGLQRLQHYDSGYYDAPSPTTMRFLRDKYPRAAKGYGQSGNLMFNGQGDLGTSPGPRPTATATATATPATPFTSPVVGAGSDQTVTPGRYLPDPSSSPRWTTLPPRPPPHGDQIRRAVTPQVSMETASTDIWMPKGPGREGREGRGGRSASVSGREREREQVKSVQQQRKRSEKGREGSSVRTSSSVRNGR